MNLKRLIRKAIWPYIAPVTKTTADRVVVMGFPRSGTSLTGRLVAGYGYSFGNTKTLRTGDTDNPHGYYENYSFNQLTKRFFDEAGLKSGLFTGLNQSLRSRSVRDKMARFFTRNRMCKVIMKSDKHLQRWAVKFFPHYFYAWSEHFVESKLVCVYRDPRTAAHSYLKKWPNTHSYENVIEYWNNLNRDMLYHMATHDSFLIKYEDMHDPARLKVIIKSLQTFLGSNSEPDFTDIIDTNLNRAGSYTNKLVDLYPLSPQITQTLQRLDENRSYTLGE